jgi:hypothetical protein
MLQRTVINMSFSLIFYCIVRSLNCCSCNREQKFDHQRLSRVADNLSASQESSHILWNPKILSIIDNSQPPDTTISQNTLTFYLFTMHFNIILLLMPMYQTLCLPFGIILTCLLHTLQILYFLFYSNNNIC